MAAPDPTVSRAPAGAPLLEASGVSFAYGRTPVLDHVDLRVSPGEFVALVGPNGSGKSTLVKLLLGSLTPTEGEVRLFGVSPQRVQDRWRLGYVPQRPVLGSEVPATVEEIVATGRLGETRVVASAPHRGPGGRAPRVGVRGPGGVRAAARERALGRAAAASVHRARVRERPAAAGAGRAHRRRRLGVAAPLPRLPRPPDAGPRRRGAARLPRAVGGRERSGSRRRVEGHGVVRRSSVEAGRARA